MRITRENPSQGAIEERGSLKSEGYSFSGLWKRVVKLFRQTDQDGGSKLKSLHEVSDPQQELVAAEADRVEAMFDLAIDAAEDAARLEIALALGEGNLVIEQIPDTQLRQVVSYNIAPTLEGFLSNETRMRYEDGINTEYIERKCLDWKDYLTEKVNNNDVILISEAHTPTTEEKRAFTDFLEEASANGVTDIGLEIREGLQEYFDNFFETGRFVESDNPDDYEKVQEYQRLRLEWYSKRDFASLRAMSDFEDPLRSNFIFLESLQEYYPILKKARELGIRVCCLDTNQKYSHEETSVAISEGRYEELEAQREEARDRSMYEKTKKRVVGGNSKMMVLVGGAHVARGGRSHKNLGDLFSDDLDVKSFRLNMDRDLDSDITMQESKRKLNINLNSVLFELLEKRGLSGVGFDLENGIFSNGNEQHGTFPFDGYIKV